jgi:hypothetical protein
MILALLALPVSMSADDDRPYRGMGEGYGHMGYGQGMMGQGYGHMGYGQGMMGKPCDDCGVYHRKGYSKDYKALTEEEAKTKVKAFISKHLKGFSITKIEKEEMPMGTMYWVTIKDKNSNEMELHVNPWGYIRGPFVQ